MRLAAQAISDRHLDQAEQAMRQVASIGQACGVTAIPAASLYRIAHVQVHEGRVVSTAGHSHDICPSVNQAQWLDGVCPGLSSELARVAAAAAPGSQFICFTARLSGLLPAGRDLHITNVRALAPA